MVRRRASQDESALRQSLNDENEFPSLQAAATVPLKKTRNALRRPQIPQYFRVQANFIGPQQPGNPSLDDMAQPSTQPSAPLLTDCDRSYANVAISIDAVQLEELANTGGSTTPPEANSPVICTPTSSEESYTLHGEAAPVDMSSSSDQPLEEPSSSIALPESAVLGLRLSYSRPHTSPRSTSGNFINCSGHAAGTRDPTTDKMLTINIRSKKSLNVDSPSFTPAQLGAGTNKKTNFSTNAPSFTPRGVANNPAPVLQQDPQGSLFKAAAFSDFTPQNYDLNVAGATNGATSDSSAALGYDPFTMSNVSQALPTPQYNPYADDHHNLGASSTQFFPAQNTFTAPLQPLQHHLYYPVTPVKDNLLLHQRAVHELFLPELLREEIQKKSDASRQVLPNSQLPNTSHYHSLVPLDTKVRSSTGFFGFSSWVYKAWSRKTGNLCCLRRIEGYRLTAEESFLRTVAAWKKISHPNIVGVVEAYTTRDFNDNSLVFVHHYHPLSKTLADHHFTPNRYGRPTPVPEKTLWAYIVQITSALRVIHRAGLAARCIDATKVILTEKNRVRLSACSVADVLRPDSRPLEELYHEDLLSLGKLILSLATNIPTRTLDMRVAIDQMGRTYSQELRERVTWLLTPAPPLQVGSKTVEDLSHLIYNHTDDVMTSTLDAADELTSHLGRELENGRMFRLMAKLSAINERPEFDNDPNWSETAERYTLKLFRDYVFHQVDSHGNPVVDLGHIVSCLNKLDAGTDEKVYLTSRDHQSAFIVSYKELRKQVQAAFGDLLKAASSGSKGSGAGTSAGSLGAGANSVGRGF